MKKRIKQIKMLLIILMILLFLSTTIYAGIYFFMVQYNFSSEENIEINSNFNINTKTAKYRNKNIKLNYSGDIDVNKLGQYKITYTSNVKAINNKKDVLYNVVDTTKPEIKLLGENKLYLNYKTEYKEPGYTATDNYDGDITSKVEISGEVNSQKMGEYDIVYLVSDSSSNTVKIIRKVIVKDTEKPKIEIGRNKNSYLILNSKININNYKAFDNCDGDITSKVKVEGTVNPNKIGLYKVTYSVTDSSGNEEILETTINVQKKNTRGIPVLMYHWFYDDTKGEKAGKVNSHNYLSRTKLEQQMKYLIEHNYYFPTYEELEKYIDKKIDLPEKSIILTADDGVTSFFKVAGEVAEKYKVPMTTFVRTRYDVWKGYTENKYLSFQSHTDMLHKPGCKGKFFGAATCASYEVLNNDIKTANDKIESGVGVKPVAFAYPYGHYSDTLIKVLKKNGILVAFTISNGKVKKGSNKYLLPRVRISKDITLNEFINKIK